MIDEDIEEFEKREAEARREALRRTLPAVFKSLVVLVVVFGAVAAGADADHLWPEVVLVYLLVALPLLGLLFVYRTTLERLWAIAWFMQLYVAMFLWPAAYESQAGRELLDPDGEGLHKQVFFLSLLGVAVCIWLLVAETAALIRGHERVPTPPETRPFARWTRRLARLSWLRIGPFSLLMTITLVGGPDDSNTYAWLGWLLFTYIVFVVLSLLWRLVRKRVRDLDRDARLGLGLAFGGLALYLSGSIALPHLGLPSSAELAHTLAAKVFVAMSRDDEPEQAAAAVANPASAPPPTPTAAHAAHPEAPAEHEPAAAPEVPAAAAATPDPAAAVALNNEGMGFYKARDYANAAARFRQASTADPSHVKARYNLACAQALLGQKEQALQTLAALRTLGTPEALDKLTGAPDDADFAGLRGDPRFVELAGQKIAQAADPERAIEMNNEGMRLYKDKRYPEAIARFQRAIELDPEHLKARYNLACTHALMGARQKALAALRAVADLGTEDARAKVQQAATDPDFASLKADPAFIELLRNSP